MKKSAENKELLEVNVQIFRSCTSILLFLTKLRGAQLPLGNFFFSKMQVLMWFSEFFCSKWIRMKSSWCNLAEQEWRRNWATWWWRWEGCKQIKTHLPSWKSLPQQMRLIPFFAEIKTSKWTRFSEVALASQLLSVQLEMSESSVAILESYRQ